MAKVTLHATIFGEDGIKTRDYETALIPDAKKSGNAGHQPVPGQDVSEN